MTCRRWTAGRSWPKPSLQGAAADSLWVLVIWFGGLIAVRYIERIRYAALGYLLFATMAVLLSLGRAWLFRRVEGKRAQAQVRAQHKTQRTAQKAYAGFVVLVLLLWIVAIVPVAASDLFRRPYSPVWDWIDRAMARLRYTYNPSGGGEAPKFPPWQNPGDAGLDYQDIILDTADGLKLAAWYVPAEVPCAPSILLAHGLQDSKWTLLRLVPWLHEAGYNVLLFDFRGHGGSDKRPTTLGRLEVLDVQAALDWLQGQGVSNTASALGQSLGAAALVNTATVDDRLDALILDGLFAEWKNVDYARGYRLPPEWLVPDVPDPAEVITRVHIPVLIIHGTADILVKVDHAQRLFAAANEPKQLWINDSGHAWSAWTYPELYESAVLTFLEKNGADATQCKQPIRHPLDRRLKSAAEIRKV